MSAQALSQNAYGEASRALDSPRSIEHRVFGQITARLGQAGDGADAFPDLAAALHDNLGLWTALAADVMDSQNALPDVLRARIMFLSEFTRIHTQKVLRREADAAPLIEINKAVMRGLRGILPNAPEPV